MSVKLLVGAALLGLGLLLVHMTEQVEVYRDCRTRLKLPIQHCVALLSR